MGAGRPVRASASSRGTGPDRRPGRPVGRRQIHGARPHPAPAGCGAPAAASRWTARIIRDGDAWPLAARLDRLCRPGHVCCSTTTVAANIRMGRATEAHRLRGSAPPPPKPPRPPPSSPPCRRATRNPRGAITASASPVASASAIALARALAARTPASSCSTRRQARWTPRSEGVGAAGARPASAFRPHDHRRRAPSLDRARPPIVVVVLERGGRAVEQRRLTPSF